MSEKDYVLGTHDEELLRLGLQHRVWRPVVLDCWQKAGITTGKRILDLGWRWSVPTNLLPRCASPFADAA